MDDLQIQFNNTLPIQLRFSDTDMLGHVSNTVYQQLYDCGKVAYFDTVLGDHDWESTAFVLASLTSNFIIPIYLADSISVQTRVSEIGTKSITFEQQLIDNVTGEIKSNCRAILVCLDQKTNTSIEISQDWKNKLQQYDKQAVIRPKKEK
jgi:acyl-CoA thioester hydrolase